MRTYLLLLIFSPFLLVGCGLDKNMPVPEQSTDTPGTSSATLEITPLLKTAESDRYVFRNISIYLSPLTESPYFCDEQGTNPNHISCETYRKFEEKTNASLLLSGASVTEDTSRRVAEHFQKVIGMRQDVQVTLNGTAENEVHIGTLVGYEPKQKDSSLMATWFGSGLFFSGAIEEKEKTYNGFMGNYFLQDGVPAESGILSEGGIIPGEYRENSISLRADQSISGDFPTVILIHMEDIRVTPMDISLRWLLPHDRKTEKVFIVNKDGEKKEISLTQGTPNTADFIQCEEVHGQFGEHQKSEECLLHLSKQTQSEIDTIVIENIEYLSK